MNSLKSNFFTWGKFFIGWPLSIISVLFIIRYLYEKLPLIESNIQNINYPILSIGILFFFLYYFIRSVLWKELLKIQGETVPFFENTYRFAMSELKRFAPGNIWSLLSRASLFSEIGVKNKIIGISLLMEIQLIIVGSLLFSFFSFPWLISGNSQYSIALKALLFSSVFIASIFFLATALIYKKKYDKNESILNSLYLPGVSGINKLRLTFISFIDFLIFGIANFFVFASAFDVNPTDVIILSSLFTFALLVGFLSFLTPMGLGVREGVVTLGLTKTLSLVNASFFAIYSRVFLIISELIYIGILIFIKFVIKQKNDK